MTADGSGQVRRPLRMLLERDVAEIERRLTLYRANTPKAIAADMGVHINTVSKINLGLHRCRCRARRWRPSHETGFGPSAHTRIV